MMTIEESECGRRRGGRVINSEVLTADEAADLLRMHVDNLRLAAAAGEITGRKVRGR